MVGLFKIEKIGEKRLFQNARGEQSTAIELEMSQGTNQIVCTAFDRAADAVISKGITAGTLVWVELRFSVTGSERRFQNIILNSIDLF